MQNKKKNVCIYFSGTFLSFFCDDIQIIKNKNGEIEDLKVIEANDHFPKFIKYNQITAIVIMDDLGY